MAQNKKLIPVESLERWLKKALEILKDGGRPGRYQTGLLKAVRNGTDMPADEYADGVFLSALAVQTNVGKISDGLNPKWRLFPVKICDVVLPRGLEGVMYQIDAPEAPAEVTIVDVMTLAGPAVRVFMKQQTDFVSRAQLEAVANEALGGRELPTKFFGKLCIVGRVRRPDLTKDEYFRAGGTRGPRKASAKKDSPAQPKQPKPRGRPRTQPAQPAEVAGEAIVVSFPPGTKHSVSEDQLLVVLKGDVSVMLDVLNLPITAVGDFNEALFTAGEFKGLQPPPLVSFLNGGHIAQEAHLNITLVIGRVVINGPWSQVILKHNTSYR